MGYNIVIEGSTEFSLATNEIILEPESKVEFPVTLLAVFSNPAASVIRTHIYTPTRLLIHTHIHTHIHHIHIHTHIHTHTHTQQTVRYPPSNTPTHLLPRPN